MLLGFDVESRPVFESRTKPRPALIQVASETGCLLASVGRLPRLPRELQLLLADQHVLKVGTGVGQDLDFLKQHFEVDCRGYVDTGLLAQIYGHARPGLKNMALHFGLQVSKSKKVQMSNWENVPLSQAQVQYAAEDAALGLSILKELHRAYSCPSLSVREWAQNFEGTDCMAEMLRCPRGKLHSAVATKLDQLQEDLQAQAAVKRDTASRQQTAEALQSYLAGSLHPTSALHHIGQAWQSPISWEVRPAEDTDGFWAQPRLCERNLARAVAKTKKKAKVEASRKSLEIVRTLGWSVIEKHT